MSELDTLRGEIDRIDREIVALFQKRMETTGKVGEFKKKNGLPVLDTGRERQVLAQKAALAKDENAKMDVVQLYECIMGISRRQQRRLVREEQGDPDYDRYASAFRNPRKPVKDPKVVYQGVPGAYSEVACMKFFGNGVHCTGLEQFEDTFLALKDGRADYAVVPIENSSTGAIRQICDLLTQYECYIVGETTVHISHCLMAPEGADFSTITHVYSHEQGLFQSEQFLNCHPEWEQVPVFDTAGAARYVAECGDVSKAAICSKRAAELYGLTILKEGVNHNANNTTRFVVVSPKVELREGHDKISTLFHLPHRSGSLHEILTIFAVNGLNVVKLESRPLPGKSWEYLFFLEFGGSISQEGMDGILHELSQTAEEFRVLGNFKGNLV